MITKQNNRFDTTYVREFYRKYKYPIVRALTGGIEVMNEQRIATLHPDDVCLLLPNHSSQLDYFTPHCVALNYSNLPYFCPVIGKNLLNPIVRNFVFDFRKWGPIIIDRDSEDVKEMKEYARRVENTFLAGDSILEFAEGGRNRHPERGLLGFKAPFFRIGLNARAKMNKPIYIIGMGIKYNGIPEEGFWEKIDSSGKKGISYFFWDSLAFLRWKYAKRGKEKITVNFSYPVDIAELAGKGSKKEQGVNVATCSRKIVEDTLEEISSGESMPRFERRRVA